MGNNNYSVVTEPLMNIFHYLFQYHSRTPFCNRLFMLPFYKVIPIDAVGEINILHYINGKSRFILSPKNPCFIAISIHFIFNLFSSDFII